MSPRDWKLYIPENDCGIKDGYYSMNEVVGLLRKYAQQPDIIRFIADMLEV